MAKRDVSYYLSKVRGLASKRKFQDALNVVTEGINNFPEKRELYLQKAEIYRAMGEHLLAHQAEHEAMSVLYITKSKITDKERVAYFEKKRTF